MAKRKKVKLPKRIAGVKIPKAARKGPVADFLNSSGGQVLLAEALVLAAGVFGARRLSSDGSADGAALRENIAEASARLSYACGEALRAFRAALEEPTAMVAEAADDAEADDDDEPAEAADDIEAEAQTTDDTAAGQPALAEEKEFAEDSDPEVAPPTKKKRATSRSETPVTLP